MLVQSALHDPDDVSLGDQLIVRVLVVLKLELCEQFLFVPQNFDLIFQLSQLLFHLLRQKCQIKEQISIIIRPRLSNQQKYVKG